MKVFTETVNTFDCTNMVKVSVHGKLSFLTPWHDNYCLFSVLYLPSRLSNRHDSCCIFGLTGIPW